MKHKSFLGIRETCSASLRWFSNSSARKIRREEREIKTELAKWKRDVKARGSSHSKSVEDHRQTFHDGPFFKVSSLIVVIFTIAVFCFGFVCDSQGSSNFELAFVEDVVSQVKDAVNPKQPIYQPTSKTEKVLGVETYQGENVASNNFANIILLIVIVSGAILYFLWRRRKRKQEANQSDFSDASFLAKQNHKGVYAYFVGALAILIILKSMKASFIQDTIELFITFLPLIIISVVSLVSYCRYLKEPGKGTEIRKKTLAEILYLLLITLIFYILFSPSSFLPMLTAFQKCLRSFLAVENIFLLLSYFLILFLAFSLIWFFIRLYQKSKGSYAGSIRALARKELYCSFALFAFVFLMTFFAFPKAYSPFTEVLGDSLYTASQGNIKLFKTNPSSYEKKSIGDLIRGVKNAFSETGSNIGDSIKQVNTKFVQDLKDTKDNLNNSIAQASKDISETLSQDISKKLNLSGGVLDGSLTIRGGITVEDSSYFGDLYPENDDLYDLGLPSKQWKNVYVRRIHGSKGVIIGNSSSNHSLGSSDDFLVSGDFETKGTAYFDGKVDMDSNNIVNLADPKEEQDAATKTYVDNMVGSGAFFSRSGSTISVSNSGDTLNMDGGIVRNIGSSDTYFLMGGGLKLANILYVTSGGADIAGDTTIAGTLTITGGNLVLGGNTITTTNNTLVSNLNADLLDGQHATYFMPLSYLDTDDLLAADSNSKVASQKAVKTYIDNSIATENLWDRSGSALSAHNSGDKIVISQLEAENADGLKLYDDGENGIFIKDGGNVGIGTMTPNNPLHILRSSGTDSSISIQTNGSDNHAFIRMGTGAHTAYIGIDENTDLLKINHASALTENNHLVINPAGKVGIGTTAPQDKLHIYESTGNVGGYQVILQSRDGGYGAGLSFQSNLTGGDLAEMARITADGEASWNTTASTQDAGLRFYTSLDGIVSEKVRILASGNVGIGTILPESLLHISQSKTINTSIGNIVSIDNTSTTPGDISRIQLSSSEGDSTRQRVLLDGGLYGTSGGYFSIWTRPDGSGMTEKIRILGNGYVGIGTTSPGSTLDIQAAGASQQIKSTTGTNSAYTNYANTGGTFRIGQDKSTGGGLLTDSAAYAGVIAHIGNYPLQFGTNNSIRMTISNGGNVGIGTTSPGAVLDLGSSIVTTPQLLLTNGFAKFVTDVTFSGTKYFYGASDYGFINAKSTGLNIDTSVSNNNVIFNTGTGNVGIGTTSPNSTLSVSGNLSVGNVAAGTSGTRVLVLSNGTIPSTSPVDSIQLYSEDVSDSSELKVRDEAGNITTLSPHNFSLIPEGRSEDLAWSYYSQRGNKAVNVDMAKAVRLVEQLSGEQLIYLKNLKSGSYDESEPATETPLAIKELQEQSQNIAALQLQTTDNITTLEDLKNLVDKNSKTLEKRIGGLDDKISDISNRMETIEDQMAKVQLQNSEEGIGLIETRLGNLEIALNVAGSDVNVLGSLSVAGNVDLLSGKLTAEDIEALGTVRAKNIEAEESVKGKTIKGDNLELGEETRGKAEIEAGDKEAEIETKAVSNSSQIYITPLGKLGGGNLYVDMENIKEGKSFKVKLDGEELDSDIEFNWLIIK